MNTDTATATAD